MLVLALQPLYPIQLTSSTLYLLDVLECRRNTTLSDDTSPLSPDDNKGQRPNARICRVYTSYWVDYIMTLSVGIVIVMTKGRSARPRSRDRGLPTSPREPHKLNWGSGLSWTVPTVSFAPFSLNPAREQGRDRAGFCMRLPRRFFRVGGVLPGLPRRRPSRRCCPAIFILAQILQIQTRGERCSPG